MQQRNNVTWESLMHGKKLENKHKLIQLKQANVKRISTIHIIYKIMTHGRMH